jgi:CRISPR/Cas system-associated exonuclease Cas4 (RecB family)
MHISYSSYRRYLDCPQRYHYEDIKKPYPVEPSAYFKLYGLLMEMFFKRYANDTTKAGRTLSEDEIRLLLNRMWDKILDTNYVNWRDPWVRENQSQIFDSAYEDVLKNLKAFDFWGNAKAEVTIDINLKKTADQLTGRLDFVWYKPDSKVEVLDGKGTNKIDKNVDIEQLYFYGLIYLLRNRRPPDAMGFLYYRYQVIKYIEYDMETLLSFKDKLATVKRAIKADKQFLPKVKLSKQCKWCPYQYECDAFSAQKEANAAKRKSRIDSLDNATGVVDIDCI